MKFDKAIYFFALLSLFFLPQSLNAQDTSSTQSSTINVFLDCRTWSCNESYIRDEITFVNFVRNKDDADLHLLITTQQTGSGGIEFTLEFIGNNQLSDLSRALTYFSAESDTDEELRTGLKETIIRGLFYFLADLPVADDFSITYNPDDKPVGASELDKWDYWVFEINADTDLEGEESEKEFSLRGRASAERITPEWKLEFQLDQYYERQVFEDADTSRAFTTYRRGADFLAVKSLSKHWSAGASSEIRSSSRDNLALSTDGSLALEYSIFPYQEFTRRQITFLYRFTGGYRDYEERTIYAKTSEYLFQQQLRSDIQFTQPWGEFEARINGSAYLHDFSKNRLETEMQLNFRIYRGLSIYVYGNYAWIRNQLAIPAGGITDAEQLLDIRERFTSYSYRLRMGLQFSFGSIFNNVVNPRL